MSVKFSEDDIRKVGEELCDTKKSLPERFRALFTLRNLGGQSAITEIARCFENKTDGELLRHELAYCLGQLNDTNAVPILKSVLADLNEYGMVRHEAAEALGAIGDATALDILREFAKDEAVEVRETVEIALDRISFIEAEKKSGASEGDKQEIPSYVSTIFNSIDPALPFTSWSAVPLEELDKFKLILLDEHERLFDRYRAMFTLRDIAARTRCDRAKAECISALCAALSCRKSALFRHEVAFVLGQLAPELPVPKEEQETDGQPSAVNDQTKSNENHQPETTAASEKKSDTIITDWVIEALVERVRDANEHCMVRHEAVEALGEIPAETCRRLIKQFASDGQRVVRESAIVALDILDAHDSFQYCDTLAKVQEAGV